jgi:predicted nucleic acid-binding protein
MINLTPDVGYLFDTSVFIDILRGRKAGKNFHYQVRFLPVFAGDSIVSETELWRGIRGLRTEEEHLIILRAYHRYFINVTIARKAGEYVRDLQHIHQVKRLHGTIDALIAATAAFYDLTLVSKNTRDMKLFENFGVKVLEYFDED